MRLLFMLCIAMPLIMSFKSMRNRYAAKPPLIINFANYVGAEPLIFDSVSYKNGLGQSYTISDFRYQVSRISFIRADGIGYATNNQFLINATDDATMSIKLYGVPDGAYTGIRFIVGADSVPGDTGNVFMKLAGISPASKATGHVFRFNIRDNIRTINLNFLYPMIVEDCKSSELTIKADVAAVMNTPHTIDLSRFYSVTNRHKGAFIADNYANMFSIAGIH